MKKLKELEKKIEQIKMSEDGFEMYFIEANETRPEAKNRSREEGLSIDERDIGIAILPEDVNYFKIQYINTVNTDKLLETKTIRQILDEHRATITDPDELKKWDSLPGDIV